MAEQKESSVLFSLKELMSLEEKRIQDEEAEKASAVREESERRAKEERAKRDQEEQRLRAEEERRRSEEQRRREEEARVEAIKHGELQKAKAETEHRSRMEAMAAQQAHEQQLASLNSDQTKKRLKVIVGIVSAVLVIGAVIVGIVMKNNAERAEKEKAVLEGQRRDAEEKLRQLKTDFDTAQSKQQELERTLASAKDDATRAKLEAELQKAKEKTEAASKAMRGGGPRPASGGGGTKCKCPPDDPLCPCL